MIMIVAMIGTKQNKAKKCCRPKLLLTKIYTKLIHKYGVYLEQIKSISDFQHKCKVSSFTSVAHYNNIRRFYERT